VAERFAVSGTGPLAFHLAYPALKMPDAVVNEVHAHNVPLQMLIENGVLGFGAFVWLLWASIAAALQARARIPSGDREQLLLFAALAAGFLASALQNLVDVVTTFLLIAGWLNLSLLLALGAGQNTQPQLSTGEPKQQAIGNP
jgi:O-antigen ligase